jgi:hypothetical protein
MPDPSSIIGYDSRKPAGQEWAALRYVGDDRQDWTCDFVVGVDHERRISDINIDR